MGFGTRFNVVPRGQMRTMSQPPNGNTPEAIWHQFYDSQSFVSAATTTLTFFASPSADRTLTNLETAGQLSDPQYFSVYDITLDILSLNSTVAVATSYVTGELNDLKQILLTNRGTWTMVFSDKNYGPYSLSTLHGTGGPIGFLSTGAVTDQQQTALNCLGPGWNYKGSIIIPPKTSFRIVTNWAATSTLQATPVYLRVSLFGILSRAVK